MSDPEKPDLEERVVRLERLVEALLHRGRSEQHRPETRAPSRSGGGEGSPQAGEGRPRAEEGSPRSSTAQTRSPSLAVAPADTAD